MRRCRCVLQVRWLRLRQARGHLLPVPQRGMLLPVLWVKQTSDRSPLADVAPFALVFWARDGWGGVAPPLIPQRPAADSQATLLLCLSAVPAQMLWWLLVTQLAGRQAYCLMSPEVLLHKPSRRSGRGAASACLSGQHACRSP